MKRRETRRAWLMALVLAVPAREFSATAQTHDVPQVIIIPDPAEQSIYRFQRITPAVVVLGSTGVVTVTDGALTNPVTGVITNATPSVTNAVSPITNGVGAVTNSLFPPVTNVAVPLTNTLLAPPTNLAPPATNLVTPLVPGLFAPPPPTSPPLLEPGRQFAPSPGAPTFVPPLSSPFSVAPAVPPLRSPAATGSPAVPP